MTCNALSENCQCVVLSSPTDEGQLQKAIFENIFLFQEGVRVI